MVVEKVEGCSWEGGSASIYIYWEDCGRGKEKVIENRIARRKVKDEGSDVLSRIGTNEEGLPEKSQASTRSSKKGKERVHRLAGQNGLFCLIDVRISQRAPFRTPHSLSTWLSE